METSIVDDGTPRPADLWDQFSGPLRSFIGRRAPKEVDSEDLLQDVFLRIQNNLSGLRESERIDAWIFQIARSVVADAFRKRARGRPWADISTTEGAQSEPNEENDRAAEVALASCLKAFIAQMEEPYRQAIELTEIRGMTQAEAARVAGISISGMKSRVQRGRRHLKSIIQRFCQIETDVRGTVIECDPLRPLRGSSDSIDMTHSSEQNRDETTTDKRRETTGCCGGAAPKDSGACCALDADVKATGGSGCGCASQEPLPSKKGCC